MEDAMKVCNAALRRLRPFRVVKRRCRAAHFLTRAAINEGCSLAVEFTSAPTFRVRGYRTVTVSGGLIS